MPTSSATISAGTKKTPERAQLESGAWEAMGDLFMLQRPRMIHEATASSPAVLVVFDVLDAVGEDLRAHSRRAAVEWQGR